MNPTPSDNGNKIRNVPHVEGNYATHISLRLVKKSKVISSFVEEIKSVLNQHENVIPVDDLHISLSNTVYLKYHQIESFISQLKKELSSTVHYFKNENNTRDFLSLGIVKSSQLKKLSKSINELIESFGNDTGFTIEEQEYKPHLSVLWSNQSFSEFINDELLNERLVRNKSELKDFGYLKILSFKEVNVTIGSRTEKIKFTI